MKKYYLVENDDYILFEERDFNEQFNAVQVVDVLDKGAVEYLERNKASIVKEYLAYEEDAREIFNHCLDKFMCIRPDDKILYNYRRGSLIEIPESEALKLKESYILSHFNEEGSIGWEGEIHIVREKWKYDKLNTFRN